MNKCGRGEEEGGTDLSSSPPCFLQVVDPAYQGYLLLPDGLPVARIGLTADHIARRGPARHPGYVAAKPGTTLWERMGLARPEPSPSPPSPPGQGPV